MENRRALAWIWKACLLRDNEYCRKSGERFAKLVASTIRLRFPGGPEDASTAAAALKSRGILVRGMAAYGLADCLRITIGTEEEMLATAAALAEVVA